VHSYNIKCLVGANGLSSRQGYRQSRMLKKWQQAYIGAR